MASNFCYCCAVACIVVARSMLSNHLQQPHQFVQIWHGCVQIWQMALYKSGIGCVKSGRGCVQIWQRLRKIWSCCVAGTCRGGSNSTRRYHGCVSE